MIYFFKKKVCKLSWSEELTPARQDEAKPKTTETSKCGVHISRYVLWNTRRTPVARIFVPIMMVWWKDVWDGLGRDGNLQTASQVPVRCRPFFITDTT